MSLYILNNIVSKIYKPKLRERQAKLDKSTIVVGDFHTKNQSEKQTKKGSHAFD